MRTWFHRGMYGETMRRLRTPALFMLALATVFDAFPLVIYSERVNYFSLGLMEEKFDTIHYSLYTIPFIVVPILMILAFRYQHRRGPSDFYFSLPLSKVALTLSQLTAVLTWTAIVIVGSSLVVALLCVLPIGNTVYTIDVFDALRAVGGSWMASVYMASVFGLALALCGTTVNSLFAATLFLLFPRIIIYTLNSMVMSCCPVLSPLGSTATIDLCMGNLLYGDYHNVWAWVLTLLKAAALLTAAVWASSKRPAELAGYASVHPLLHVAFRTAIGTLLSLPAVWILVQMTVNDGYAGVMYNDMLTTGVVFFYLIALAGYYLYELLTTRKAKNLWKATLWLPLLAAINLLFIGGCVLAEYVIEGAVCTTDTVQRVELRAVSERMDAETLVEYQGYTEIDSEMYDLLWAGDYNPFNAFYKRTKQYAASEAPYTSLTSEKSRAVVCKALERALKWQKMSADMFEFFMLADLADNAKREGSDYTFCIDVVLHDGWIARSRRVFVTENELRPLLEELDQAGVLPDDFEKILQ